MKVEVELPEPPGGKRWQSASWHFVADHVIEMRLLAIDIPKPKRVLYHETGEFRPPRGGESFKATLDLHEPLIAERSFRPEEPRWILRREEVDG